MYVYNKYFVKFILRGVKKYLKNVFLILLYM